MKKSAIIISILLVPIITGIGMFISYSNSEVKLRNRFTQKYSERTAFYDKMWKILSQKGQIALKNDSSFRQNIDIIMQGRKDAPDLVMKWIAETNPNANYSEVSALYKDLSRAVEAEREGFFNQEKMLQDLKLEHDNLLDVFPSSVVLSMMGKNKHIEYKPITSTITDAVITAGKDVNVKIF
jgi:hypothetical protein